MNPPEERPYMVLHDDDAMRQLVAADPEAAWIVVDEIDPSRPQVLSEDIARGEAAHWRGVIGNPAWVIGDAAIGRIHIYPMPSTW